MSAAVNPGPALIYQRPAELLQHLIRFDTTNPPGNERACVTYIQGLLEAAGVPTWIFAKDPERPNLLARLKGRGSAPPLLLYGHVDVVSAANQTWTHPPFAGEIADGFVWGRGALDMKGGVAMMLAAFLKAQIEQADLPGDLLLLILSDEENLSTYGAKFMVEEHADLFEGVRYAIGEFGGFTLTIGGKRFYPIQVAEKQACWLRATFRGPAGHGSMPVRGGAMTKLGQFLQRIDRRLPPRVTEPVRLQFSAMADGLGGVQALLIRQLLNPALTDRILDLLGEKLAIFDPLLHNTVSPTLLQGGGKINVIPERVAVELDARLVPGAKPEEVIAEIRAVTGVEAELEVVAFEPGPATVDMGLFSTLRGILKEADPEGIPIPLVLPAVTDGRFFARLGIQTYGYLPMNLPPGFQFAKAIHAGDERIPVECLEFGTQAIHRAMQRFG
ncbi:MAG: M20/M25/M40 family metallo-hydrolase [Bacillota bacterium]